MAATRKFELPGIQDLTKEQELIRALPKAGQHLIVGGPGHRQVGRVLAPGTTAGSGQ